MALIKNPSGSWFGLPDFGITEALFGNTTYQGGSNAVGPTPNQPSQSGLNNLQGQAIPNPIGKTTQPTYNPATVPAGALTTNSGSAPVSGGGGAPNPQTTYVTRNGETKKLSDWQSEGIDPYATQDPYAALKAEISGAWDSYIGSLSEIGNTYLPQQLTAGQNIANTQLKSGQEQINTQRSKSLRDIGANIKNAFQAGNVYLGARGAGDSSAANQYQFALSQEASKQTGQVNEFVNGQLNQLQTSYDTRMNELQDWFANAQAQLKQQIASGQLNKSQDITNLSKELLNTALAWKQQLYSDSQARYNALLEWAASNSSNVGQLTQNIAAIPQAIGSPTFSGGSVNTTSPGYGIDDDERQQLFSGFNWF